MNRLAWFAPDPKPESLLDVQVDETPFDYYTLLIELAGYSLVNRSDGKPEFSIHRKQEREIAENSITTCVKWIDKAFAGDPTNVKDSPVLQIVSHFL